MKACRALTWSMALFAVLLPFAPAGAGTTGTLRGHDHRLGQPRAACRRHGIRRLTFASREHDQRRGGTVFVHLPRARHVHREPLEAGLQFVDGCRHHDHFRSDADPGARSRQDVAHHRHGTRTNDDRRRAPGTTSDVYSINSATQHAATAVGGPGGVDYGYSAACNRPWTLHSARPAGLAAIDIGARRRPWGRRGRARRHSDAAIFRRRHRQHALEFGTTGVASLYGRHSRVGRRERTFRLHQSSHQDRNVSGIHHRHAGLGSPVFYHKASIEIGGANQSRNFSYFLAASGVNQDYRYCGQNMCGGQNPYFFRWRTRTSAPASRSLSQNPRLDTSPRVSPATAPPGAYAMLVRIRAGSQSISACSGIRYTKSSATKNTTSEAPMSTRPEMGPARGTIRRCKPWR